MTQARRVAGLVVAHAVRNDTGAYDVTTIAYGIDTTGRRKSPASDRPPPAPP